MSLSTLNPNAYGFKGFSNSTEIEVQHRRQETIVVSQDGRGDYDNIQHAIEEVESGGMILIKEGTYVLKDILQINKNNLTIEGGGNKTIITTDRVFELINYKMDLSEDLEEDDVYDYYTGLKVQMQRSIDVIKIYLDDVNNYPDTLKIYSSSGTLLKTETKAGAFDDYITTSLRMESGLTYYILVAVDGESFDANYRTLEDGFPYTGENQSMIFTGSAAYNSGFVNLGNIIPCIRRIETWQNAEPLINIGDDVSTYTGINIRNLKIDSGSFKPLNLMRIQKSIIENCYIKGNQEILNDHYCDSNIFLKNTFDIENITIGDGTDNTDMHYTIKENNFIKGNIILEHSNNNIISQNIFDHTTGETIIQLYRAHENVISGNILQGTSSTSGYGIEVVGSKKNVINGNIINKVGEYGIYIHNYPDPSYSSINSVMSSNIITECKKGIYTASVRSIIIGNNVYDNTDNQIQDLGATNVVEHNVEVSG